MSGSLNPTEQCHTGEIIKCKSDIRLYHVNTQAYLHSHQHLSPLSNRQEVSGFVDEEGEGDE
eukprot:Awhi_evm1s7897